MTTLREKRLCELAGVLTLPVLDNVVQHIDEYVLGYRISQKDHIFSYYLKFEEPKGGAGSWNQQIAALYYYLKSESVQIFDMRWISSSYSAQNNSFQLLLLTFSPVSDASMTKLTQENPGGTWTVMGHTIHMATDLQISLSTYAWSGRVILPLVGFYRGEYLNPSHCPELDMYAASRCYKTQAAVQSLTEAAGQRIRHVELLQRTGELIHELGTGWD